MFLNINKALFIAPHTDDIELGAGGLVSKLSSNGCEIHFITLSNALASLPKSHSNDPLILLNEARSASRIFNIRDDNIHFYDFPVRNFHKYRQEILDVFISFRSKQYDLVIIPSSFDTHQDHSTTSIEALRAFKGSSIIGYELPWNDFNINYNLYVQLSVLDVELKLKALSMYLSQSSRSYFDPEIIKARLQVCGLNINTKFAERFEVIRWLIK